MLFFSLFYEYDTVQDFAPFMFASYTYSLCNPVQSLFYLYIHTELES
jgi:hypothetical protein